MNEAIYERREASGIESEWTHAVASDQNILEKKVEMKRRDLFKTSAAVTASTAGLSTVAGKAIAQEPADVGDPGRPPAPHAWDRPLHFVYAGTHGKRFPDYTDKFLLDTYNQVQGQGEITAITPFLLNVKDPAPYAPMIRAVHSRGIVTVPGVGRHPYAGPITSPEYKDMAKGYRDYTDYIRLENMQGFMRLADGQAQIQEMIDYLTDTLGFKHIMLNPWPTDSNGIIVPFHNPELDASFNQVQLDFDRKPPYTVYPNPENWLVNTNEVNKILDYRPWVKVVVNYESVPQHAALNQMELANPGSSEVAMNITATQCQEDRHNLYWAPPFTHIYNPIDLDTWGWIANRLGQMPSNDGNVATP